MEEQKEVVELQQKEAEIARLKAEVEAQAKLKAEIEAIQKEKEAIEEKLKNASSAAARLATDKKEAKDEVEVVKSELEKVNKDITEFTEFVKQQKEAEKALEIKNKKEFIKAELTSKGFASAELLVETIDVESLKIVDGKIEGFEEKVKEFKEKHPTLYVDSTSTSTVSPSITLGGVKTTQSEVMEKIYQKATSGETMSSTEQLWAMFGHTIKK